MKNFASYSNIANITQALIGLRYLLDNVLKAYLYLFNALKVFIVTLCLLRFQI